MSSAPFLAPMAGLKAKCRRPAADSPHRSRSSFRWGASMSWDTVPCVDWDAQAGTLPNSFPERDTTCTAPSARPTYALPAASRINDEPSMSLPGHPGCRSEPIACDCQGSRPAFDRHLLRRRRQGQPPLLRFANHQSSSLAECSAAAESLATRAAGAQATSP